ncbi:MAG: peptidylprolyl isomerase [Betaproteobacteria bacterium]|nr:peptidylprolyl isomerase [Betaproteobacteria bacterium]
MFDWVHNNKRFMQVILALIFLPFAFFGVDSYFRGGDLGAEVARIGDYRIGEQEYQQALRERQEAMRRMLGNVPVDQAVLDSPEMRFAALDQLVRQRLLLSQAVRAGLTVTDSRLHDFITSQDAFREGGQFSYDLYESYLRSQNASALGFEARVRRDLLLQPLVNAFGDSSFVPNAVMDRMIRLSEQTREVSIATIDPSAFVAQISIDEPALKAYYDSHPREFQIPEQVRVAYVVLSLDNLAAQVDIPPEEVRQAYEQNPARFSAPEERQARHILVSVPADASAEAKAAAKSKAEELLKQAKAQPDQFAELARKHSQDPGSSENGGDLGFLVRGATKKPFDDALFAMKEGEIAGLIETEFGYHLIKLDAIRGGTAQPFEQVRPMIESELKKARASKRYAEAAEKFNNIAYEQSDSLTPAAEALGVKVQESPWISRTPSPGSPLGNERFLKAVFSEEVLQNKRNSEVVEVASGTLIAARLLEHKPASTQPFDTVRDEIRTHLVEDEARKRALAEGREKLEKLEKGVNVDLTWSKPVGVRRADPQGLSEPVLREIFRVDASSVPAYGGAEGPKGGYQLIRILRVSEPTEIEPEMRKAAAEQLNRLIGQEQLAGYVSALKQRVEVKVKPELIEKK